MFLKWDLILKMQEDLNDELSWFLNSIYVKKMVSRVDLMLLSDWTVENNISSALLDQEWNV